MAGIYKDAPMFHEGRSFEKKPYSIGRNIDIYDNCHTLIITFIDGADGNIIRQEECDLKIFLMKTLDGTTYESFGSYALFYGHSVRWKIGPRSQRPGSDRIRIQRNNHTDTGTWRWNCTQLLGVLT